MFSSRRKGFYQVKEVQIYISCVANAQLFIGCKLLEAVKEIEKSTKKLHCKEIK